ncbi:MipA/OmpV family protein [Parvularcula bermudensis]|nr:MipA/OmpV family protein [Parvularcula bermudensis]
MALSTAAVAQGVTPNPSADPRNAVGLGIGAVMEAYRDLDEDTRILPTPVLRLDGRRFSVSGTSASYSLLKGEKWEAAATLDYRFQGYDAEDSPIFQGMDDRDSTLEGGGWYSYKIGPAILTAYALTDLFDRHGGYELRGVAAYKVVDNRATKVTPYLGLSFQSEDLANYYYGVEADEAATLVIDGESVTRAQYVPGETLTPFVGITARQALSRKWAIAATGRYEFLPDEVVDSPLTDADSRAFFALALARLF